MFGFYNNSYMYCSLLEQLCDSKMAFRSAMHIIFPTRKGNFENRYRHYLFLYQFYVRSRQFNEDN